MQTDYSKRQNRYFLGLDHNNIIALLEEKQLEINPRLSLTGIYRNINKILLKESSKLSEEQVQKITEKIIRIFSRKKVVHCDNKELIKWIAEGNTLIFYLKDLKEYKIHDFITSSYLLSIKEDDIFKIFARLGYKTLIFNEKITDNCKFMAAFVMHKNRRVSKIEFVFKTKQHIIIIAPHPVSKLEDCKSLEKVLSINSRHENYTLNKINLKFVDEIVDNCGSLPYLEKMIFHNNKRPYLIKKVETIANYFDPFIIPVGEFEDMLKAIKKDKI